MPTDICLFGLLLNMAVLKHNMACCSHTVSRWATVAEEVLGKQCDLENQQHQKLVAAAPRASVFYVETPVCGGLCEQQCPESSAGCDRSSLTPCAT